MKIIKSIIDRKDNIYDTKIPIIAFTGDSVTQGCFECNMVIKLVEKLFEE